MSIIFEKNDFFLNFIAAAIGCFVCSSINKNNPGCEDTFNNTYPGFYQSQCQTGRKDRTGLFPASACVKFKGTVGKK